VLLFEHVTDQIILMQPLRHNNNAAIRLVVEHRPRVADTFAGGGSIPFEAARVGCDAYASDLNPIACMLTWGAINVIGAHGAERARMLEAQKSVAAAIEREIRNLGRAPLTFAARPVGPEMKGRDSDYHRSISQSKRPRVLDQ
jgi:adenine-specific DNA methylase